MPRCVWNGNNFPGRWSFSFTENSSILCAGSVVYDTSGSPMATAALQARPSHAHRYPLRCTVARLCFFGDPCCMQSNSYFFVPLSLRVKFFFFFMPPFPSILCMCVFSLGWEKMGCHQRTKCENHRIEMDTVFMKLHFQGPCY